MIGITGGIASGKSTVAKRLRELGASVLDADQIAKEVVEPQTQGWEKVKVKFPEVIQANGEIDRRRLGQIIFSDPLKRQILEDIIHPLVKESLEEQGVAAKKMGLIVFAEVPLLFEVGWENWLEPVWLVYVRPEVQLQRLLARTNLSEAEALNMINAQIPLEDKVKRAEVVIDNNGDLKETWKQVDALWQTLGDGR